jgi:superfamily I DNA and/or RNA helicase
MKIINGGRGIHQREIPGIEKLRVLPDNWLAFTNMDISLPGKGSREIDVVLVAGDRLIVIDLKDLAGPISSKEGNWFNGKRDIGRSPVQKIIENKRLIFSLLPKFVSECEKKESLPKGKLSAPTVNCLVVLTNSTDKRQIAPAEASNVFGIDAFIRMVKNPSERTNVLGRAYHSDITTPEWQKRLREFFNVSSEIFRPGVRSYGGFRAKNDSPTFKHATGVFAEFDVEERDVPMSLGLLRRWDFTKAETRFQSEEGRALIVGREKKVISWLDDRNPRCGESVMKPRADDPDQGVDYWEVFERRTRLKRLGDFCSTEQVKLSRAERIELARQVITAACPFHELNAAHLDLGMHSVWVELPTTIKFSHLMSASFPEVETLGKSRFQFLSSSTVPEEEFGDPVIPVKKDVFLLGTIVHTILFGKMPEGSPPTWRSTIDEPLVFPELHAWLERSLEIDQAQRFANATEMLEVFNEAVAPSYYNVKAAIAILDRHFTIKSQRLLFKEYPESETLVENDRVCIWRSEHSLVKQWKGAAIGDISKERTRIASFLERARSLCESPISGLSRIRAVHWTGDSIAIVQDYVSGKALQTDFGNVPDTDYASVSPWPLLLQLVQVVMGMHESGFGHGDIKPANIIVAPLEGDQKFRLTIIDALDFSPEADGDRMTPAYAPVVGNQLERDRFAVCKIAEEISKTASIDDEVRSAVLESISKCIVGPPANATLSPLRSTLERLIDSPTHGPFIRITVGIEHAESGPLQADEGHFYLSTRGQQVKIRGAFEQLEFHLDPPNTITKLRRSPITQLDIRKARKHERRIDNLEIFVDGDFSNYASLGSFLEKFEIDFASSSKWIKPDAAGVVTGEDASFSADADELDEAIAAELISPISNFDIRNLWDRMVCLEAELKTEATAVGDSTFRKNQRRHVVSIEMNFGEMDFDRQDTVLIERVEPSGNLARIGYLDIALSTPSLLVFESWIDVSRGSLVLDGTRLRFNSRYEDTSYERRLQATERILGGRSAIPELFQIFQPEADELLSVRPCEFDLAGIEGQYGLNKSQASSFRKILETRPLGLLQGPPGTGKTRFIGALVHFAITHGIARNVLLTSQSHEAVNNAAEAVLRLFGPDRDTLSLIRVGGESSVSDMLKPFHVTYVEKAYKDRFRAGARQRLGRIADRLGITGEQAELILSFEETVRPILRKLEELSLEEPNDQVRVNALLLTVEQILRAKEINVDLSTFNLASIDTDLTSHFIDGFPSAASRRIQQFRNVVELSRDIVGSVSSWQRSFDTFLAGTRQVVAGTCVGLGRATLGLTKTKFDLVVVDEAARCTSSELAVAIQSGRWIVLVGDHCQLEPTHSPELIQRIAKELELSKREVARSDFERLFESKYGAEAGSTLKEQYRMLPPIGRLVSSAFYQRSLLHRREKRHIPLEMMPSLASKPLVWVSTDSFGPAAFQSEKTSKSSSLTNKVEANLIVAIIKEWSTCEAFAEYLANRTEPTPTIGIICAYSAQSELVRKQLQKEYFSDCVRNAIKVGTIDSYQGKENEIVLLSLVRNNEEGVVESNSKTIRLGFMSRKNRINVSISRAKDCLIIVGAKGKWPRSSPLGAVAEAFEQEEKAGEAMTLDAKTLLEQLRSNSRPRKKSESRKVETTLKGPASGI